MYTERLASAGIIVPAGWSLSYLVAAWLLIELGEKPATALQRVRAARPGAVETVEQEKYVLQV